MRDADTRNELFDAVSRLESAIVSLRSDAHYRGLVEAQLKHAGIAEPPVSVEDVAAVLGVPLMTVTLPKWFSGAIVLDDGTPVLLLNAASPPDARRSVLAHLMAHILIRIDDPSMPYPRDSDPDHRLAEVMAGELIMPAYLVKEQASKWFNDYRYLARLFGVSEHMMTARMRDMGLLKAHGLAWDY